VNLSKHLTGIVWMDLRRRTFLVFAANTPWRTSSKKISAELESTLLVTCLRWMRQNFSFSSAVKTKRFTTEAFIFTRDSNQKRAKYSGVIHALVKMDHLL